MRHKVAAVSALLAAVATLSAVAYGEQEPSPREAFLPVHYRLVVAPDPANMRFEGEVRLHFEALRPMREIALNSVGLDIRSAQIDGRGKLPLRIDEPGQRVVFTPDAGLLPGPHDMVVRYAGRIVEGLGGFFRPNEKGKPSVTEAPIYASACCVAKARQLAPLLDEPDMKAVFALELIVDGHADAVANMPVESRQSLPGGKAHIVFRPTPKMSPHQLFFAVGNFERSSAKAGAVDVGILLPRGTPGNGAYALAATRQVLEYLNQRLAPPYPLPKLDSVAFSSSTAGAIEYWGSILYADRYIAVGEGWSSPQQLQAGFMHVAHEVSHQWFGDLVTSRDWRHNWLNEGFAEWLANEVTNHFHPEWNVWLQQAKAREEVMQLDARSTSHPVVQRTLDISDQGAVFDSFTYVKGSQVIRMLAALAGEDKFSSALRDYLREHAYGSVSSDDLWRALSARLPAVIEEVGRDFTQQEGVPLIDVLGTRCEAGNTIVTVRQDRYGLDEESRKLRRWRVPVSAMTLEERDVRTEIVTGPEPSEFHVPGCGALKVNVGGIGYFRTRYDPATLGALQAKLSELSQADRRNLLDDQRALAQ